MFAKTIIDSDAFLDMSNGAQCLYFHLSMRADDEGFINNPKKIMRIINCCDDDFKILIAKKFILTFSTGVVVIKHWRIHNYIKNDRFKPTLYQDEKNELAMKKNKTYTLASEVVGNQQCLQNGVHVDTQVSLGKVSLGKVSISTSKEVIDKYTELVNTFIESKSSIDDKFTRSLSNANKNKYADTLRKLERIDGYTYNQISDALNYSMDDDFWSSQIISLECLRKKSKNNGLTKFNNLYNKMTGKNNFKSKRKEDEVYHNDSNKYESTLDLYGSDDVPF